MGGQHPHPRLSRARQAERVSRRCCVARHGARPPRLPSRGARLRQGDERPVPPGRTVAPVSSAKRTRPEPAESRSRGRWRRRPGIEPWYRAVEALASATRPRRQSHRRTGERTAPLAARSPDPRFLLRAVRPHDQPVSASPRNRASRIGRPVASTPPCTPPRRREPWRPP